MLHNMKHADYERFVKDALDFATDYEYDEPVVAQMGVFYFYNSPIHRSFGGTIDTLSNISFYEQIKKAYDNRGKEDV